MRVFLESRIAEAGGEVREVRHTYDGTWFRQPGGDYLVYLDEGIHTTLRWGADEARLYRRGDQLEAYQVFRPGQALDFELAIGGNKLPMTTMTHAVSAETGAGGGEIRLEYSLCSGPTELGEFTLSIRMEVHAPEG
ncbi:MAG: DUF1934 domain-containing protein [Candidatus Sericytochromatia bacterium]|nr:DUF1934 domain-containing protein [Candidatus Tanganyikabacteria bacterium]